MDWKSVSEELTHLANVLTELQEDESEDIVLDTGIHSYILKRQASYKDIEAAMLHKQYPRVEVFEKLINLDAIKTILGKSKVKREFLDPEEST